MYPGNTTTYPQINFHYAILDSISDHIAVINQNGDLVYTNYAWNNFAKKIIINTAMIGHLIIICKFATNLPLGVIILVKMSQ